MLTIIAIIGALILLSNPAMGRILILHFSNRDRTLKVKLSDDVQLNTILQLTDHLSVALENVVPKFFNVELLDENGKFSTLKDESVVNWQSNFLSVLIIDLTPRHESIPYLCIDGRAFDTSSGLSIVSEDGSCSIIQIKVDTDTT